MTTQKPVKKICKTCGKEFETTAYARKKCDMCADNAAVKNMPAIGKGNADVIRTESGPKKKKDYDAERAAETSARMAEVGFNYGEVKKQEYLAKLKAEEEARKEEAVHDHITDAAKMVESEPAEEPVAPDTEEDAEDPKKELEKIWDFVSEQNLDFDSGAAVILLCNGEYEMAMRHLKHKLKVMKHG